MLIGLGLAIISLPICMAGYSGCQLLGKALSSSKDYLSSDLLPNVVNNDILQNTETCFFGNGNMN